MRRDVQAVVLVLLGGVVLRLALDGTYLRYVKEQMQWPIAVAGAVLLGLGIVSAWRDGLLVARAASADPDVDDGGEGHHDHQEHHGPRVAWALLLPVLALLLVAPPALGSWAAERGTARVAAPVEPGFEPLPAAGTVALTLSDYATRAVWDEGRSLRDRSVALTGFVTPAGDDGWYVTRIALSCCAADGRPVKVLVRDAPGPAPGADSWVRVTGEWVPGGGTMSDTAQPRIAAAAVEPVPEPADPYE